MYLRQKLFKHWSEHNIIQIQGKSESWSDKLITISHGSKLWTDKVGGLQLYQSLQLTHAWLQIKNLCTPHNILFWRCSPYLWEWDFKMCIILTTQITYIVYTVRLFTMKCILFIHSIISKMLLFYCVSHSVSLYYVGSTWNIL